jgi:hypothetical protein
MGMALLDPHPTHPIIRPVIGEAGQGAIMGKPQRIGTDHGERKVLADIAEYGWHSVNVIEDDGHPP